MADKAEAAPQPATPPVTIKKYANRRLYNTATSSYVTLDHLCQMVKENTDLSSTTPRPARTSPARS
jgi:polyhydroxyalkanoate synthesis regulator protein